MIQLAVDSYLIKLTIKQLCKICIFLTSFRDRQQLQSGQAISWYFIEIWEGNWSGIRKDYTICFGLFCFDLVLQLCI